MSEYFLGEIRMFPFDWPPADWALCNGAVLPISQNQALYSLLSKTFGGDGKTTFQLPDLQGRTPAHPNMDGQAPKITQGQSLGSETVTLTQATIPPHSHAFLASTSNATGISGANTVLAVAQADATQHIARPIYGTGKTPATLIAGSISTVGADAPHPNMQPFAVVNFCIALQGQYPMRP